LFDLLLAAFRTPFNAQFVEVSCRTFSAIGHYSLYVAAAIIAVFSVATGLLLRSGNIILVGMALSVILLAVQYVSRRILQATVRLQPRDLRHISSTAVLDCLALASMVAGLLGLVALSVLGVETSRWPLLLAAIASFVLGQFAAVVTLNPATLGLKVVQQTTPGEEALGLATVFVQLIGRMAPVAFGVLAGWGTILLLACCAMILAGGEQPPSAGDLLGGVLEDPMMRSSLPELGMLEGGTSTMLRIGTMAMVGQAVRLLLWAALVPPLCYLAVLGGELMIDLALALLRLGVQTATNDAEESDRPDAEQG